jgi:hypothetical protein
MFVEDTTLHFSQNCVRSIAKNDFQLLRVCLAALKKLGLPFDGFL